MRMLSRIILISNKLFHVVKNVEVVGLLRTCLVLTDTRFTLLRHAGKSVSNGLLNIETPRLQTRFRT